MTLTPSVGSDDYTQGPDEAAITLVEYGDYECSYCGQAYPIVKDLQRTYPDSLRFCFRNFPIPEIHPQALRPRSSPSTPEVRDDSGKRTIGFTRTRTDSATASIASWQQNSVSSRGPWRTR